MYIYSFAHHLWFIIMTHESLDMWMQPISITHKFIILREQGKHPDVVLGGGSPGISIVTRWADKLIKL